MRRCRCLLLAVLGLMTIDGSAPAAAQPLTARDLLTAARRGDVVRLRRALDAGVPADAKDPSFGQTALIRAAMFGQAEAAKVLLAARATADHAAAPQGMRAIHWAAQQGSPAVIQLLIAAGASPNAADADGTTPLEYALRAGAAAAVPALLAGGARAEAMREPIARRVGAALNADTPGGELDALVALIRAGRDLERGSGLAGERTALLALAERANRPGADLVARALVTAGANLAATNEKGLTARQIVEAWVPTQRHPPYRRTLEAVLAVLRDAEARR